MDFREIYDLYKDLIFNLALQYTQNVQDAQEITQDTFLAVHDKLSSFKNESHIKTWVYRITINKSLDFLKARKRKKRWGILTAIHIDDEHKTSLSSRIDHPGLVLEHKEALERIFDCINQLNEREKTVIVLAKIEGLSTKETADIMKLSPKAVESLFQRAKKKLAQLLAQNEGK